MITFHCYFLQFLLSVAANFIFRVVLFYICWLLKWHLQQWFMFHNFILCYMYFSGWIRYGGRLSRLKICMAFRYKFILIIFVICVWGYSFHLLKFACKPLYWMMGFLILDCCGTWVGWREFRSRLWLELEFV